MRQSRLQKIDNMKKQNDSLNRLFTQYELDVCKEKIKNWSYSNQIKNGFIELGNGIDEEPTALLSHDLVMEDSITNIEDYHILPI